jgi:hypothetical protein
MPELLTRRETPQSNAGRAAGFKSERWPDLFRNGGRHQIGTMAGFLSEYPAGFNRNPQIGALASPRAGERSVPLRPLLARSLARLLLCSNLGGEH